MKCDQDSCLNLRYDLKNLLWQDELNPRVRCAFGDVYDNIRVMTVSLAKSILRILVRSREASENHPTKSCGSFMTAGDLTISSPFASFLLLLGAAHKKSPLMKWP